MNIVLVWSKSIGQYSLVYDDIIWRKRPLTFGFSFAWEKVASLSFLQHNSSTDRSLFKHEARRRHRISISIDLMICTIARYYDDFMRFDASRKSLAFIARKAGVSELARNIFEKVGKHVHTIYWEVRCCMSCIVATWGFEVSKRNEKWKRREKKGELFCLRHFIILHGHATHDNIACYKCST